MHYVIQQTQEGYGHAVYCAREFVGEEPFLLLLGDHVLISAGGTPCSRQAIDVYCEHEVPVTGVQRTPSNQLHLFGTLAGTRLPGARPIYEVTAIKEKPTVEYAEEHLRVEGVPRDQYLCFFGVSVFPPVLFDALEYHIRNNLRESGEIQLTSSLELLRRQSRYLATEIEGGRYDMGVPQGFVQTQLALALHSPARRQVLAALPHLVDGRGAP
jgi:UTP--glucose-1-phosphate uridylyltransferase